MNFDLDQNTLLSDYLTTKDNDRDKQSIGDKDDNSVEQLRLLLNSEVFHNIAQKTLKTVNGKETLAECAELISGREKGGLYYKTKFWAKIFRVYQKEKTSSEAELRTICKKVGITSVTAKKLANLGEQIASFEKKNKNGKLLRDSPNKVLETAKRQKGKTVEYLKTAATVLVKNSDATANQIHKQWCKKNGGVKANLDIIKPSDWWAFSHPKWRKEADFDGSIPGEIYANTLYYFAPRKGVAVDAMAGSGMLKRVYDDREKWQKDSDFKLEIFLYDINPQREFITKHDAFQTLPVKADWIFLDPPYFGQSDHLFKGILSETKDYAEYIENMTQIIKSMETSLNPKGRICVFLPKWSGLSFKHPNYNVPKDICDIAETLGLSWIDTAFVSRGRQQEAGSAMKNISAKQNRRMRSDTCVLNVFGKSERI